MTSLNKWWTDFVENWVFTIVLLHYRHAMFLFNTVTLWCLFLIVFSSYLYSVGCFRSPLICYVLLPISSNWVISWRFSLKHVFVLQKVAGVISAPGFLLAARPNCVFVLLSVSFDCWFSLECGRNVGETCFLLFKPHLYDVYVRVVVRLAWLHLFPFLCGRLVILLFIFRLVLFVILAFGLSDEIYH